LNIDTTRQCQLGRRIAPPVIATFELARVFMAKKNSGFEDFFEAAFVSAQLVKWQGILAS
jgi:hypothetical protein